MPAGRPAARPPLAPFRPRPHLRGVRQLPQMRASANVPFGLFAPIRSRSRIFALCSWNIESSNHLVIICFANFHVNIFRGMREGGCVPDNSCYRGAESRSKFLSFFLSFVRGSFHSFPCLIRIHARHVDVFRISGLARIAYDSLQ